MVIPSSIIQHKVLVIIGGDLIRFSGCESRGVSQFASRHISGKDPILIAVQVVTVKLSERFELVDCEAFADVASFSTGNQLGTEARK